MRRDEFSLAITDVAWVDADAKPRLPTVSIAYEGDPAEIRDRLRGATDEPIADDDADLAVRLQRSAESGEAEAVLALTHRLTGDYILELAADPEAVLAFTRAAREYGEVTEGGPWYRARVLAGNEVVAEFEKETLLVYGPDGELLRQHSLIPGGVEL